MRIAVALLAAIVAAAAMMFGIPAASACTCMKRTLVQEVHDTPVIFVGRIVDVRTVGGSVPRPKGTVEQTKEQVTFRVLKIWKGPYKPGGTIVFETDTHCCMCGRSVRLAEASPGPYSAASAKGKERETFARDWLVFANGEEPYKLSMCSHSAPLHEETSARSVEWLDWHLPRH